MEEFRCHAIRKLAHKTIQIEAQNSYRFKMNQGRTCKAHAMGQMKDMIRNSPWKRLGKKGANTRPDVPHNFSKQRELITDLQGKEEQFKQENVFLKNSINDYAQKQHFLEQRLLILEEELALMREVEMREKLWDDDQYEVWQDCIQDLKGSKGRVMSNGEAKLILIRLFTQLKDDKGTLTTCCSLVAKELFVGHNMVRKLHHRYMQYNDIDLEYSKRGKGSTKYAYRDSMVDAAVLKIYVVFWLARHSRSLTP